MGAEQVTEEEVDAAVRQQGLVNLEEVEAAILETDGSVTVMPRTGLGRESVLFNVASQRSGEVRS